MGGPLPMEVRNDRNEVSGTMGGDYGIINHGLPPIFHVLALLPSLMIENNMLHEICPSLPAIFPLLLINFSFAVLRPA